MKWIVSLSVALVLVLGMSGAPERFDNYRTYQVQVETDFQLHVLQELDAKETLYFEWTPLRVGQDYCVTGTADVLR